MNSTFSTTGGNSSFTSPSTGRSPSSLAFRLSCWYSASAFILILAATSFLYWALITNLDREDDQMLADKVQVFKRLLRERPGDLPSLRQEVEWESTIRQNVQMFVRVLDGQGAILMETPGMTERLPATVFPDTGITPNSGREIVTPDGKSFRLLAEKTGQQTIQVALDRTYEEDLLTRYRHSLWVALGVGLLGCALVGFQIARRGLRPLMEITRTAARIRSTTLNERIEAAGLPLELSTLAQTFNEMLDRLEESFQRLSRFSADIAHELRNPVNNLRGEAEVALGKSRTPEEYRGVLESCLEECGRLSGMIDGLLFLARAENPRMQIERQDVDLAGELAAVREFYEPAAAESGIQLRVEAPSMLTASLDRVLFQRAVGNLVTNALAHTGRGGTIHLRAFRHNNSACVEVTDTGSGIDAVHIPHLFDRFYRADPARPSANGRVGLGLAIVKSIAHLHGGTAKIESTVGQGTTVRLSFPIAANATLPAG
jgi:two-component system heavy metal sensor histidine kinase CusS